jgi:putative membrane protein
MVRLPGMAAGRRLLESHAIKAMWGRTDQQVLFRIRLFDWLRGRSDNHVAARKRVTRGSGTSVMTTASARWTQEPNLASDTKSTLGAVAEPGPDLGVMRTMMAADRTMMAWIRTSLSMLTFGYTIYKVLQEIQEIGRIAIRDTAPRNAGLLLTVTGTLALVTGIAEYWVTLMFLRRSYMFRLARPSLIMSILLAGAGVFLSVGILVRLL